MIDAAVTNGSAAISMSTIQYVVVLRRTGAGSVPDRSSRDIQAMMQRQQGESDVVIVR